MTTGQPPFPTRLTDIVFALKTFAAAMLALVIALRMDLSRPYWAMATVYVISNPLAGATSSKAFYRLFGTVIGASASVVIIPNLVDAPELMCVVVSLWVGFCIYLSQLDSTPRSYVFILAGYTVAFIGFPELSEPANIFDAAVVRVEEIALGIICASLVSSILFPQSVAPAVAASIDKWLSDVQRLGQSVLAKRGGERASPKCWLDLTAAAGNIDALSCHLDHDKSADFNTAQGLRILHLHMLMLLPLLASISDRVAALQDRLQPELAPLLDDTAKWVSEERDDQSANKLRTTIAALQPVLDTRASWEQMMIASLLVRLRELIDLVQDCRKLRRAIAAKHDASQVQLAFHPDAGAARARHRDHTVALWSGMGAAIAILVCCGFSIESGWPDGATAPMMAAVACSLFAAHDDPAPRISDFAWWSMVSMFVVAIYLFALLPKVSNIEMLVAALAPAFLMFGVLLARPATAFVGLILALVTATLLALQSTYSADFAGFANTGISLVVGAATARVVMGLSRSVSAEWSARRLVRTTRMALASIAARRGRGDRAPFVGVMLHRIELIASRLAVISDSSFLDVGGLGELRIGLNIIDLRGIRARLTLPTRCAIDNLLNLLTTTFRSHADGPVPLGLITHIDLALTNVMTEARDDVREAALIGLTGIRRALFPDAPPFQFKGLDPSAHGSVVV